MKPSWQWNEEDILSLIQEGEKESLIMDYKECDALNRSDKKKNEISKDVSAFANSAGGTIIYGIIENGHVPIDLDIGYDPNDITKEWLEQVINSRIQRKIDGIKINQVELTNSRKGKVLYVVYIPQSNRAPHMASDKRFYKRYNFESVPMEEYEIRDVANRSQGPDIALNLSSDSLELNFGENQSFSSAIKIKVNVVNNSPVAAEYTIVNIKIDSRIKYSGGNFTFNGTSTLESEGQQFSLNNYYKNNAVPHQLPLWEGVNFNIGSISLAFPKDPSVFFLIWEINSPRMLVRRGIIMLKSDGQVVSIDEPTDIA